MEAKEAIKRLRQETCPATYMQDFDKEECLQVIEDSVKELEIAREVLKENNKFYGKIRNYLKKWCEILSHDGINSKMMVKNDIQYILNEVYKDE